MRKMITLINREFWEQRSVFFNVPMILSGIFILVATALLTLSLKSGVAQVDIASVDQINQGLQAVILNAFTSVALPFVLVLWFIVFYYFLGSLYDDRKDGSILFWQSMPIGQTQTIISKLVAGLILAPFCTWVVVMVTQLIILCIASVFFMAHPVFSWTLLWNIPAILLAWLKIFGAMLFQAIWLLPIFAWFMLCSAYSKKAPALRALVPLVVIVIIELLFFRHHYFAQFLATRFEYAYNVWYQLTSGSMKFVSQHGGLVLHHQTGFAFAESAKWLTFGIGLAISLVCAVIAGWFRSRCYDFEK